MGGLFYGFLRLLMGVFFGMGRLPGCFNDEQRGEKLNTTYLSCMFPFALLSGHSCY